MLPIPTTLGSAVRSSVPQREVSTLARSHSREQQARIGTPVIAGVTDPDQQDEAGLLSAPGGRKE